ncbi:hypothetical protein AAE478_004278 [Parahypoxylon ruwenzoriense]
MEDQSWIGVIDLKTCLRAVADCSPELLSDSEKDYTVYAFDYSEPDMPLVGQGMLSWGLCDKPNPRTGQRQFVTGRITKNLLAIIGNGIRETLEVRLKLTAIPRIARTHQAPPVKATTESTTAQRASTTPTPSESTEWNSFCQSNSNLSQSGGISATANPVSIAPEPTRPFRLNNESRNDMVRPSSQGPPPVSRSRPSSIDPSARESQPSASVLGSGVPEKPVTSIEEQPIALAPARGNKPQSRPTSRASNRPPSGRPRGRPRKKPLPTEGNTSGYEDITDADDGPSRKKRATTTKVERSNTATFGSAPDSLRVAASTAGSIRNFRPISTVGDASIGSHGQDIPRAPTPIPDSRLPGFPHVRPTASSSLRRESILGPGLDGFTSSYLEFNRSAPYGQDARSSPADSAVHSPSQVYTDEASPVDIGSSPPVPRPALYSVQSSSVPSSPILPPMPMAIPQPDSGFMSGSMEEEPGNGVSTNITPQAPTVAKPKPKPRRSRAKKAAPAKVQNDLIIHTETPGPPELLPQTSIYNPPHLNRKNSENAKTATASEASRLPTTNEVPSGAVELSQIEGQSPGNTMSREEGAAQGDVASMEATLTKELMNDQRKPVTDSVNPRDHYFTPATEDLPRYDDTQLVTENTNSRMVPPSLPHLDRDASVQPELPMVSASDPVLPQLTFPVPQSDPPHPQTDTIEPTEGKSNKNFAKRQLIKMKLEEAVSRGQLPSFCRNCGALQTPTWRKIWKQEHRGMPTYHEYSEKPGHVTAINVLERDDEGTPTLYEVIKKSLGPTDSKSAWAEILLCNPCGIWFSKFKAHRPPEKWDKDEQRLSQTRKKRANGTGLPRAKKARTKSDAKTNLTSEPCLPTDPFGPLDESLSPKESAVEPISHVQQQGDAVVAKDSAKGGERPNLGAKCQGSTHSRGSTRSGGSGTPGTPIALDDDLGGTRRILFPSPRKDGEQKILGDVAVNIVQASPDFQCAKERQRESDKENDDFIDIFGTPPRPSTPPPKAGSGGPFKTPTHPTPSHRPVTRSVTRSMRSGGPITSPSRIPMERTPTKTPSKTPRSSAAKRHSPGDIFPSHLFETQVFDTPLSRSLSQLLSGNDHYVIPSPSRGFHMDLSNMPPLAGEDIAAGGSFDFGDLLNTDVALPSSPPLLRNRGDDMGFGRPFTYDNGGNANH